MFFSKVDIDIYLIINKGELGKNNYSKCHLMCSLDFYYMCNPEPRGYPLRYFFDRQDNRFCNYRPLDN